MVVYGWIHNDPILNTDNFQSNNMAAKGVLICRANSHPFQERTVTLEQAVKIGRSVARARAASNNAIFDCKVLSRNHALLWYEAGKFYLQDTKSSNGTFINNQRLSTGGQESVPREVCSGDIVQFGVDVMENTRKVTHGCIVATLKLYLPDGKEAKASPSTSVASPASNVSLEDLYKLNQFLQEANRREEVLNGKLVYLQSLVESTRQAADQSWKALIDEDRLLSRVETVESQLAAYSKNFSEDKIRNELVKLQEDKAQYQSTAKEALQKILQEKLEVTQKLGHLERQLNDTEEECQSLHEVAKSTQVELQELAAKYTEAQTKLAELSSKLEENEDKVKEMVQKADNEKQDLLERIEDQARIERILHARLKDSRLDSVNIHKQVTALRNYMQTLQDMNLNLISDENTESKDEINPIEAINTILNKLNTMPLDNCDSDQESISYPSNRANLDDLNQMKCVNSDHAYVKPYLEGSLIGSDSDVVADYIVPPQSRRTLVNGNANLDNLDSSIESDNSEATDDTYSVTSDDASEKSVIEVKRIGEDSTPTRTAVAPVKLEVRFASDENGEQLEVHYEPEDEIGEETDACVTGRKMLDEIGDEIETCVTKRQMLVRGRSPLARRHEEIYEGEKGTQDKDEECEGEHLEGDYIKTLKPISKSDSIQKNLHSREYVLQTLIGSLDSLKGDDDMEAQQLAKKELEDLRDWLVREPNEIVLNKLKELYYCAKNETQRIQEVNEELVILKEKYNTCTEEKTELVKKFEALKAQCGDLLNATYTVPIQYVVPIAIALLWMLLEKIF